MNFHEGRCQEARARAEAVLAKAATSRTIVKGSYKPVAVTVGDAEALARDVLSLSAALVEAEQERNELEKRPLNSELAQCEEERIRWRDRAVEAERERDEWKDGFEKLSKAHLKTQDALTLAKRDEADALNA